MALRTVRRNGKEARAMWETADQAVSYTIDNYFIGKDVPIDGARAFFERSLQMGGHVKVWHSDRGYTVHYHSNHWLELRNAS